MQKLDFKCPICGYNEYGKKEVFMGPSSLIGSPGSTEIEYYYCEDCSVIFRDVEKFSSSTKTEKKED